MKIQYTDEMLAAINEKADLISYASQTMDLEKRGDDYFTHCPKHEDKTPSLSFNPEKNYYYCFSCGVSGQIINFLKDFEGLSFIEAVQKASKIANVDMNSMCFSNTIAFLRKVEKLHQKKREKYHHEIISVSEYNKYIRETIPEWLNEGITQESMDRFGIRADTFQNRIIYPVYDIEGNLINIKGRTRYENFKELRIPKYMNYFPVGVMDYFQGLNLTLPDVQKQNEIIIFESIKSVMKADGWGYHNCASAEKHTLTNEQIELLASLKVNVVFAYDTDVNYARNEVKQNIDKLKRLTNVYIITDPNKLLGGSSTKNAPVDLGPQIWETLYDEKKKVV